MSLSDLTVTPAMGIALRNGEGGRVAAGISKATLKGLIARGPTTVEGHLTDAGHIVVMMDLSLAKQCHKLGIPLTEIDLQFTDKPELAFLSHLERIGVRGCFTEGGIIRTLMYCMCFSVMRPVGEARWGRYSDSSVRSFMYNGIMCVNDLLETDPSILTKMFDAMRVATTETVLESFDVIKSWQRSETWWPSNFIGMTRDIVRHSFTSLGAETLSNVARIFFLDPYAFAKGWPDLAVLTSEGFKLIEVKTSDRLQASQLITIGAMRQVRSLRFEVIRLRRT